MNIGLMILNYSVVQVVAALCGPVLFWFISKTIVKFENNSIKQHVIFWLCWGGLLIFTGWINRSSFGILSVASQALTSNIVFAVVTQVALTMKLFKVELKPAAYSARS